MARSHGRVQVTIWADEDFRALSSSAQRVYLMLISQPQINNCGVLPYVPRKWSKLAPDTPLEVLAFALNELDAERFIVVDEDTQELLVRSFVKHDRIEKQPMLKVSAKRQFAEIESERVRETLRDEYPQLFGWQDRQKPLFQAETEGVSEPLSEGVSEGDSRGRVRATPTPSPTPSRANGSPDGPDARNARQRATRALPIEKDRQVRKLLDVIGDHADEDTEGVVRAYAVALPEGSLAKVAESVQTTQPVNRAAYVVAALASERREAVA